MTRSLLTLVALLAAAPASAQFITAGASVPATTVGCVWQVQSLDPVITICGSAGSGTVSSTGSRTAGKIPKWSAEDVLTDSLVSESGSVVTVTGTMNATSAIQLNGCNINTSGCVGNLVYVSTAPALTGTNFTGIPETAIADGSLLARIADAAITWGGKANYATGTSASSQGDFGYSASFGSFLRPKTGSTNDFTLFTPGGDGVLRVITGTDNVTLYGGLAMPSGERFYVDGGTDTYITGADNQYEFYANSAQELVLTASVVEIPNVYSATSASAANVVVINGGQLLRSTSSLRYKADVQDFSGGLADLLHLRPVSFTSRTENDGPRYVGFLAEDFDAAGLYNIVNYDDSGRPDAIQYDRLTTYMVNAFKELAADVDVLKKAANLSTSRTASKPDTDSRNKAIDKEKAAKAKRDKDAADRAARGRGGKQ